MRHKTMSLNPRRQVDTDGPRAPLRTYRDPLTGEEHPTRRALRIEQKKRDARTMTDFEAMVRERTLTQDPWSRLPTETEIQFARFRTYLTMNTKIGRDGVPRQRSIRDLSETLKLSYRAIQTHASRYYWALRAQCWDRELERQLDEEFKQQKRESVRRQAKLGAKLQALAERGASNMLATGGADLTASDVVRLADVGVKIERLAHDKSTSNEAQSTRTVFVYEGQRPKWADAGEDVVARHQLERPAEPPTLRDQLGDAGAALAGKIMGEPDARD